LIARRSLNHNQQKAKVMTQPKSSRAQVKKTAGTATVISLDDETEKLLLLAMSELGHKRAALCRFFIRTGLNWWKQTKQLHPPPVVYWPNGSRFQENSQGDVYDQFAAWLRLEAPENAKAAAFHMWKAVEERQRENRPCGVLQFPKRKTA